MCWFDQAMSENNDMLSYPRFLWSYSGFLMLSYKIIHKLLLWSKQDPENSCLKPHSSQQQNQDLSPGVHGFKAILFNPTVQLHWRQSSDKNILKNSGEIGKSQTKLMHVGGRGYELGAGNTWDAFVMKQYSFSLTFLLHCPFSLSSL